MDFLNLGSVLLEVAKPKGMWEYLIFGLESLVKNYGLTIILITLAIKLVMLPFDFYNRYINKRNSYKMAEIQPELTKIQAKYGNNKEVLNQKTMEVYKRHNYNIMGSCGGMPKLRGSDLQNKAFTPDYSPSKIPLCKMQG